MKNFQAACPRCTKYGALRTVGRHVAGEGAIGVAATAEGLLEASAALREGLRDRDRAAAPGGGGRPSAALGWGDDRPSADGGHGGGSGAAAAEGIGIRTAAAWPAGRGCHVRDQRRDRWVAAAGGSGLPQKIDGMAPSACLISDASDMMSVLPAGDRGTTR